MAIKLHRCKNVWVKVGAHPCWRVQSALDEAGIQYEIVRHPWPGNRPELLKEKTGQDRYPAVEFEDGTWYREESKDMAETIRAGKLNEKHGVTPVSQAATA
jgi:Glutathione S-transferase, N-terminal domain